MCQAVEESPQKPPSTELAVFFVPEIPLSVESLPAPQRAFLFLEVAMQSVFQKALEHALAFEGGYVNDPRDPGGETIYGISRRHHPEAWADGRPTKEQAAEIYLKNYWQRCRCSDLPAPVAVMVFDAAINQGAKDAIRFLQVACGARPDSIIGPRTIAEANGCDPGKLARDFAVERAYDYALLDHLDDRFGRGWMRRTFACYDLSRSLL